jgi:hypothetical protein
MLVTILIRCGTLTTLFKHMNIIALHQSGWGLELDVLLSIIRMKINILRISSVLIPANKPVVSLYE